jgi:hypothetical protein
VRIFGPLIKDKPVNKALNMKDLRNSSCIIWLEGLHNKGRLGKAT